MFNLTNLPEWAVAYSLKARRERRPNSWPMSKRRKKGDKGDLWEGSSWEICTSHSLNITIQDSLKIQTDRHKYWYSHAHQKLWKIK